MPKQFDKLPIALDVNYLEPNVTTDMVAERQAMVKFVDGLLREGNHPGSEFTGWLKPETIMSDYELAKLNATAKRLANDTDVMLVIGIGGSYLGARAVIEALADDPGRVVYAGQNMSAHYMTRLKALFKGKRVAINVVSKSGTTTEPAIAFRVMRELVDESVERQMIVATTDANKGSLLDAAHKQGWETYVVPDDIGGRYSVLSAVGLLPIAYAGIDIAPLIAGAKACADLCASTSDPLANPAYFYAAARNVMYQQGFGIEVLASFEPRLHYLLEWWKQLYGESEGKENMALFPASVDFTTDLHSLGQYIQEGRRVLAETFLIVDGGEPSLTIPESEDPDGLDYLAGQEVSYVNSKAYEATASAHRSGGVPNMTIHLQQLDAYSMGALIYFFEIACAVSGLMLNVNPFNQPGVEAYKKEMFKLLGKPGYESTESRQAKPKMVSF
ncbi:MAG: glucose-6-phosphate isomerase [Armatimonadota bacterium]|nr:glucose-6-phosphate isomerase [bacterium]